MTPSPLERVRRLCMALPGASERLSHGEPTWFVNGRVFAMFANNHHGDGHVAVWLPAPPGLQEELITSSPRAYYRPPYVGVQGWVGVELSRVSDLRLSAHIELAHELVSQQRRGRAARPRQSAASPTQPPRRPRSRTGVQRAP